MRSMLIVHRFKRFADALLIVLVHFDAFRADPYAYLTALKWWLCGKRVRARGQFAPLLSQSRHAYQLWVKQRARAVVPNHPQNATCTIIALIDLDGNPDPKSVALTRRSLAAEGIALREISASQTPSLIDVIAEIDWTSNPWLLPIYPGDMIAIGAGDAYRAVMAETEAKIIYADDDVLIGHRRVKPYFKPDWNSELFSHQDYLTGACVVRATCNDLAAVAGKADWAAKLVEMVAGKGQGAPVHLREMLHHRSARPLAQLPAHPIVVHHELPLISVIVPTRNRMDLLRECLNGVATVRYPSVEVIVIDNDSDEFETLDYLGSLDQSRYKILRHGGAFNYSAMNNRAVAEARGKLLCLLNNDIEMKDPDWLSLMARQALRPDVGAVGARLLYPDGRIQHAGVVIGVGNAAGHAHRFLRPDEEGYFNRHNLPQFTTAVTAACLVVERDKFLAVGGLNERDFAVAFNDVDLCLRLNERGWQSLYEPRATLIHHESVSRGTDRDPVGAARFAEELASLKRLWRTAEVYDPYHHPDLSRASEQFSVAL